MVPVLTGAAAVSGWSLAAVICFIAGLAAIALFSVRRGADGRLLALTLNNMTQGVVLFDSTGCLVVRNDRYIQMYGLSPEIVKPGTRLLDIVGHRYERGTLQRDPAQYCAELLENMAAGKSSALSPKRPMAAQFRWSTAPFLAANTGLAPTTTLPSGGRLSRRARF
jgi:PAS domain-containing protein